MTIENQTRLNFERISKDKDDWMFDELNIDFNNDNLIIIHKNFLANSISWG